MTQILTGPRFGVTPLTSLTHSSNPHLVGSLSKIEARPKFSQDPDLAKCEEELLSDEEGSLQPTDDYDSADDSASDEPAAQ